MTDQEIRAKALEIAVLIQGREDEDMLTSARKQGGLLYRYKGLATDIEQYIRQGLPDQIRP